MLHDDDSAARLDRLEAAIVRILERESRMSILELSRQLGVSRTAISERLARLIEQGVIRGFHARIDYAWLGYPLTAFVGLEVTLPQQLPEIIRALTSLPEVEDIHATTGQNDLLLKVRARSTDDLQRSLLPRIHAIPGTRRREMVLALSTYLEGAPVGMPRQDSEPGGIAADHPLRGEDD